MPRPIAAALVVASAISAQSIPMPAYGGTYTAAVTHGFLFVAPVDFTITGIEVYNEQNQPSQVVEVINFGSAPPPSWPGTAYGTRLHYDNSTPSGSIAPMIVPVITGQHIAILCACTPSPTATASFNSYAAQSGPFTTNLFGNPLTLVRIGTNSGIAANNALRPCWLSPNSPIARAEVYVQSGGGFATKVPFGTGCNRRATESFYEVFDNNPNAFDLSNTSLAATFRGNGYIIQTGANAWFTPQSLRGLGDDRVSVLQLPFTFPYPGGTTNTLYVSSNGFVYLQADGNHGCCAGDPTVLLTRGSPRWAALWNDLDPTAGGRVYFDIDTANSVAYVTFDQVPQFGTLNPNTFQYAFHATGDVALRYQNCTIQNGTTVVGFSPGSSIDPGAIDISAVPIIATQPDSFRLALFANARPVMGSTINLTVGNLPSSGLPGGASLAALIYGLTKHDPGIDLTSTGMPGCLLYASIDTFLTATTTGSSFSHPLQVPSAPGLSGVQFVVQGIAFNPAAIRNAAKAASSNGIQLGIGRN